MASTYSTNLALDLMANGDQSGTWGTTTNTNLGTLIEQAISGYVTQAITDGSGANTTITIPNGTTGVARNMVIEMTGALTFSTTSLIVPANKKLYFIFNNTTGGFAVTVKVSGQTGILVPNGKKVVLTSNGTDIVEAHTAIVGNATMGGTLGVTGATTLSSTLAVTGATTLSSTLAAGATTITGAATVSTTLGVTGATTLSSTLAVTGATTLSSTLAAGATTITGAATVSTTLGVTGTSTMAAINASGTVAMAGAATVGTTLGVTGASTLTGTLGLGTTPDVFVGARMRYSLTTAATQYGFFIDPINSSAATTSFVGVVITLRTTNAVYTTTNLLGISIADPTKGASHTITNNDAISINDQTAGSTRNSGVRTMLASGAGKYNIITHTAQSVIGGNLRVGGSTDPTVALDVTGAALISTTLGVTGTSTMAAINASGAVTSTSNFVANGGQFQIQASSVTKWQLYRDGGSGDLRIYDTAAGLDRLQISTAGAVTIPGTLSVTGAVSGGAATFTTGAFALAQDTTTIVSNSNSDAVGTSAQVRFSALASTANALLVANGAGRVATRYGVTLANAAELLTTTGSSLLIGSTANVPIVFGVAGAEVGRFALTGLSVTGTLGVTGNITVGAGNKFTTDAGNDLNLDAPSSRSLFLKIGGSTKVTVDNAGAVTIPGTLGVGSANAVAYGREQIFGTIAKATTTDEVTLFTGSSDATGALGLRITNKNHATAGSRAVFLEAAEPGVAIRTLQLNNSGYTIDSSGNTVIPGTLGVTGAISSAASVSALNTGSGGTIRHTGTQVGASVNLTDGQSFTFTTESAKLISVAKSTGDSCLFFADYTQTTITLIANPGGTGIFAATAAPTAGILGISKSATSHVITVKNGTGSGGSSVTLLMCALGTVVSASTAPA